MHIDNVGQYLFVIDQSEERRAVVAVFFFKQKTAYEIRKGDWSSDVCSSDLGGAYLIGLQAHKIGHLGRRTPHRVRQLGGGDPDRLEDPLMPQGLRLPGESLLTAARGREYSLVVPVRPRVKVGRPLAVDLPPPEEPLGEGSEAAVFWLTGPDRPPILGPASDDRL